MSYIGNTPTSQAFAPGTDTFSGTGSQTAFTLSRNVSTVNDILVVVNNVEQQPSNYTVSGTTLTFSPAPSSGTNNIYVRYLSTNLLVVAPQAGSIVPGNFGIDGNLNFSGSARRITGDFSNATTANRVMFQSSTLNGQTSVSAIPNGISTIAQFSTYTGSTVDESLGYLAIIGGSQVLLGSDKTGTGTYLPMTFYTGGSERMRLDTSGNVGIGTSSPSYKLDITAGNLGTTAGSTISYQRLTSNSGNADYLEITNTRQIAGSNWNGAGSRLQQKVDATWMGYIQFNGGSGTANDGGISFGTGLTATSSVSIPEQARITSTGLFQFNSGYGSVATAYGCRAWVNFNGTGTVAIRASGNVSSITDGGVGTYTVNFTTAMPDINYCPTAVAGASGQLAQIWDGGSTKTASAYLFNTMFANSLAGGGGVVDPVNVQIAIFR